MAERRALRLFLHNPELREVLAVLALSNPLHREAMGCLMLQDQRWREADGAADRTPGVSKEDGLMGVLLESLPLLDPPLEALISPLVRCGEAVRCKLAEDPSAELMSILDVLEPVE
jgi:hypothetical protein